MINDATHAEVQKAFKLFDELMDAIKLRIESDSLKFRETVEQDQRDKLNTGIYKRTTLALHMGWSYQSSLLELKRDIEQDDVAYTEEDRLSGLNYDYDWLPEYLKKTNKGYKNIAGKSPVLTFMKEMKSAGYFR
jgi:hypothetical protein